MIRNIKEFRADVEIAAQTREVEWDAGSGRLVIQGLKSFTEMAEVLHLLSLDSVFGFKPRDFAAQVDPTNANTDRDTFTTAQVPREPPSPARVLSLVETPSKLSRGGEPSVTPPVAVPEVKAEQVPAVDPTAAPVADKAPNMTAFGRVARLGEVVDLSIKMGKAESYDQLKAFIQELMDSEMCPILTQKVQEEGGLEKFWDRLQTLAQSKKVPGAIT